MSEWITPRAEDIDLDTEKKDIHIWLESDDFGNRYVSIEGAALKHLKKIMKEVL